MPSGVGPWPTFVEIGSYLRSKVVDPAAHGFIGNDDPALSQQIFHVAEAKGEPKIQPNRLLNDLGRKAVATVICLCHGQWLPAGRRDRKP
jgi:hypothetical protein